MAQHAQPPVESLRGRPRVACATCGLRITLDTIVACGSQRSMYCERCHVTDTWQLDLRD